jgi:adenylate cyclase
MPTDKAATASDAATSGSIQPTRLRFDRYVLDLTRGSLLLDDKEIALRPKTFAILQFLVENCGRLVSKDEIFAAVWPDLAVTDDTLVQGIGELRRAFAEDGMRLIKTVPRRGYRLEYENVPLAPTTQSPAAAEPVVAASSVAVPPSDQARLAASPRRWRFVPLGLACLLAVSVLWGGVAIVLRRGDQPTYSDVSGKPGIAVLPFLNESGDPARQYFADGLTQDLINALGRFSELTVMSWNAVLPYGATSVNPQDIARRLRVRYQVEGSVRQTGDRVRVTTQLVDGDGRVLWSTRLDEALADLFALQDKLTVQLTQALTIRVTQAEQRRVFTKRTESLEAYDCVLRARPVLRSPERAGIVEARALLRRAIQIDPNYAAAYAALAETFYIAVSMGWAESPTEFLGQAEELANKALKLDDTEVRAHVILGRIDIFHRRYAEGEAEMNRALAINPNDAQAIAGRGNALMWLGRSDAAIDALEQAQRIDPTLNPLDRFALSLAYYLKGYWDAAIDQAELNLRQTPGARFSRIVLAAAYAQDDQQAAAARVAAQVRRLDPTFDPQEFGTKFLNPIDLETLRAGLRKAGLFSIEPPQGPER